MLREGSAKFEAWTNEQAAKTTKARSKVARFAKRRWVEEESKFSQVRSGGSVGVVGIVRFAKELVPGAGIEPTRPLLDPGF
jgi:hypothetical protein